MILIVLTSGPCSIPVMTTSSVVNRSGFPDTAQILDHAYLGVLPAVLTRLNVASTKQLPSPNALQQMALTLLQSLLSS